MFDLTSLRGTLIVSCQAPVGSPLRHPDIIAAIAEAAVMGGAAAIRANGADHVAAIKQRVDVPVLGLVKRLDHRRTQWITPTLDDARSLAEAGADVVATDATLRTHALGPEPAELMAAVRDEIGLPVLADVDGVEAARAAEEAGADAVATTLAGYTEHRAVATDAGPDLGVVREVVAAVDCPVIAEGRYQSAEQVSAAISAGAFAVVVGTAICNPIALTARFVTGVPHPGAARHRPGDGPLSRHPETRLT